MKRMTSDVTASLPASVSHVALKPSKSQENLMMTSIREGMKTPDSEGGHVVYSFPHIWWLESFLHYTVGVCMPLIR